MITSTPRALIRARHCAATTPPMLARRTSRALILTSALLTGAALPTAKADVLDDIAITLEQFGSGGPMSYFPSLGGALSLISSASSFLAMIPGLGGLVSGLNSVMGLINDIQITFGPIMQTSRNIAQYVRGAAEGKRAIESLFNARDLNDAATALNNLTHLAGGKTFVNGAILKNNPQAAADASIQEIDQQIRTAEAALNQAEDETVRTAIRQRLKLLANVRRQINHTAGGVRALQNNQRISTRSTSIPGQQAQVSAQMMSAAAGATSPTATGKLTVAAVTEQTSAVTNSLANLSQQFTEMAGLQVATNDSLDVLVSDATRRSIAEQMAAQIKDERESAAIKANRAQGMTDATVAGTTIDKSLNAESVRDFDAARILFR